MTQQFHDHVLNDEALDQIFREARSYNGWLDKNVSEEQLQRIYDLMKMGPTSANQQPARIVWVRSEEGRNKLGEFASEGNTDKIRAAPVTAIIGYDIDFHEELPWLFPHTDAKSWFEGDEQGRKEGVVPLTNMAGQSINSSTGKSIFSELLKLEKEIGILFSQASQYSLGGINFKI